MTCSVHDSMEGEDKDTSLTASSRISHVARGCVISKEKSKTDLVLLVRVLHRSALSCSLTLRGAHQTCERLDLDNREYF
jgi:hypothetical protein